MKRYTAEQIEHGLQLLADGASYVKAAEESGVPKTTLARLLKKAAEQDEKFLRVLNERKKTKSPVDTGFSNAENEIRLLRKNYSLMQGEVREIRAKFETLSKEQFTLSAEVQMLLEMYEDGKLKGTGSRGGGRQKRITQELIDKVYDLRQNGTTLRKIAEILAISLGLVHKIIKSFGRG